MQEIRARVLGGGTSSSPRHNGVKNDHNNAHFKRDNDSNQSQPTKSYHKQDLSSSLSSFRYFKSQWALLSTGSKVTVSIAILLLTVHVVVGTWDLLFGGVSKATTSTAATMIEEKTFAVAINTYKRPDRLQQVVRHYADTCGRSANISQVFIIWAEQGAAVPTPESFFESSVRKNTKIQNNINNNRAEVIVLQKDKDSLNSRFEPISQLTSSGVFMVDDDIRVSCSSLAMGFHAWTTHPDSLVGYYPRLAAPTRNDPKDYDHMIYHLWPAVFWRQRFNIILTKACFLHAKYLSFYFHENNAKVRDLVDEHKNCEDIAMAMLVANTTMTSAKSSTTTITTEITMPAEPIYVQGTISDKGLFGGISSGTGHFVTRSECLTRIVSIYHDHGWDNPMIHQFELQQQSWIRHQPGFWWQSAPSNIFEWFGFVNFFS